MTRLFWMALVVVLLLPGCARSPEPRFRSTVQGPFTAVAGAAEGFVPLVPASDKTPRCEDLRDVPRGMGSRLVSFVFGDEPEQRIAVALGDDGEPVNYSDMRGDLNASDGRDGDRTMISINLVQGHALAQNRREGGESEAFRMDLEDALDAASLGRPRTMMERILATCTE